MTAAPLPCPPVSSDLAPVNRPTGGKIGQVIRLLEREGGVSLAELMTATGWQAHSVRGALSTLKKRLGRPLQRTVNAGGVAAYRLEAI